MAEASVKKEDTFDVPSSLFGKKTGFSLDVGGSLVKIAYATDEGEIVRLHFVSFPTQCLQEALGYLKQKIEGTVESGATVLVCGMGCNVFCDLINQVLDVNIQNYMESDCFIDGFQFLTRAAPVDQLVHEPSKKAFEQTQYAIKGVEMLTKMWAMTGRMKMPKSFEREETNGASSSGGATIVTKGVKVEYPLMLLITGSAGLALKVEEDGTYDMLELMTTGGKTLLGLGSLFSGAKSFEELVELAATGSSGGVSMMAKDLAKGTEDIYSGMDFEQIVFMLGNAAGKDRSDFKKEDLASGAVDLIIHNIGLVFHLYCTLFKVKQAFFCGGMVTDSEYIREEMTKYFHFKNGCNTPEYSADFYFLKLGTYLGVLGALLHNLQVKVEAGVESQTSRM